MKVGKNDLELIKEKIELIFNLGADACYKTIDQNTGHCDEDAFNKLKNDAVNLFCKPDFLVRIEQLNCEHEWKVESFDCYGMPYERYCEQCGKKEAI